MAGATGGKRRVSFWARWRTRAMAITRTMPPDTAPMMMTRLLLQRCTRQPRTRVVPHPKAQVVVVVLGWWLWCWVWIGSGERSVCTQKRVMENQHPTRRVVILQGRGGYVATPELGVGTSLGNNGPSSVWLWIERVGRVGYLSNLGRVCACAGLPANCEPVRRAHHFG